jgi:hypothetical protein
MPRPVAMPIANDKRRRPERTEAIRILKPAMSNIPKRASATVAAHANDSVNELGKETSLRPCIPRNERNLPRIRSWLHVAPISQNDQPQPTERKLLAQTVRIDGQSLSHSLGVAQLLNSYAPPRKEYCFRQNGFIAGNAMPASEASERE